MRMIVCRQCVMRLCLCLCWFVYLMHAVYESMRHKRLQNQNHYHIRVSNEIALSQSLLNLIMLLLLLLV